MTKHWFDSLCGYTLFLIINHLSRNNAVDLQRRDNANFSRDRSHFNGCVHVRGSTSRRTGIEDSVDRAAHARWTARSSRYLDEQHGHAFAASEGTWHERVLYGGGIGTDSKGP